MKKAKGQPLKESKTSRFGIYLDSNIHRALRKAAIDERISASELIERLIREYLTKKRKASEG